MNLKMFSLLLLGLFCVGTLAVCGRAEGADLGGLSPEKALEYMKTTNNLVIVEVNAPEWKLRTGFTGALHIPYTEMSKRYDEIPKGCPVILYCGGGIVSVRAYETLVEKRSDIPELSYIAAAPPIRAYNEWLAKGANLGGLSPEKALEYMKTIKNLVIVDVATTEWYNKEHFEGAIHIPIEELGDDEEKTLFMNIPAGRPVLLHCRRGVIVPGAYRRLKELRPDILEIAYIAGAPLFDEYN